METCLCIKWQYLSHLPDSNQRPADYKSAALPTELRWLVKYKIKKYFSFNQMLFCLGLKFIKLFIYLLFLGYPKIL